MVFISGTVNSCYSGKIQLASLMSIRQLFRNVPDWGNGKFVSSMYKHPPMPPFCYESVYIRV